MSRIPTEAEEDFENEQLRGESVEDRIRKSDPISACSEEYDNFVEEIDSFATLETRQQLIQLLDSNSYIYEDETPLEK